MRIVSFNINGVRARMPQLTHLRNTLKADVVGLQEIKVANEMYPVQDVKSCGYSSFVHGQKAHYGVSMLYTDQYQPTESERVMICEEGQQEQARLVYSKFTTGSNDLHVYNGYFPNGESNTHPLKYPAKRYFYKTLSKLLRQRHDLHNDLVVLMGDLNVSPEDKDTRLDDTPNGDNYKRWLRTGKCSFLPEEREWLQQLIGDEFFDTWREDENNFDQEEKLSWFDYRSGGFEREPKKGLRIDHIWVTAPLLERLIGTGIDYEARAMEKPSDHCPVWADFSF